MGMFPGQTSPQPKPTRPEKVEEWEKKDFFSAKAENDPKLPEAIVKYGQRMAGKPEAALMLAELIAVEKKPEPKPQTPNPPTPNPTMPDQPPGEVPVAPPTPQPSPPPGPSYGPGMGVPEMGMPGMGGPETIQLSQQALEAAIWAIVLNNTSEGRGVIAKILAGQINTGADRPATETALKYLAAEHTPDNEAILLAALITPEKFRPPQPGEAKPTTVPGPYPGPGIGEMPGYSPTGPQDKVTAAALQQRALELVKTSASPALRANLANFLVDPKIPLDLVNYLGAFLKEPHPDNLRAQLIIYQGADTLEQTRTALLDHFLKYSSDAMGLMLGVTGGQQVGQPGGMPGGMPGGIPGYMGEMPGVPNTMNPMPGPGYGPGYGPSYPGGPASPKPDLDLPYRIASQVWGPEFSAFLEKGLAGVEGLEVQPRLLLLASTVPTSQMRFKLHETLEAHWQDGPAALEKDGFPGQVVFDPSLLMSVKLLPRAKAAKPGTTPPGTYPNPTRPGTRPEATVPGTRPGTARPVVREKELREQAEQDWLRVSADMVSVLCQRFQQAGMREIEIARQERRRPDFKAPLKDLPLDIHERDLTPKPSLRLVFPSGAQKAKVSGVELGPMLIHYVRLEHKEKLSKVLSHYKNQLKTRRVQESQQGTWLDVSREGRAPELLRSIDVLISRATGAGGPGLQPGMGPGIQPGTPGAKRPTVEEVEDLVVQILVIETRDPSQDPSKPPTAAKVPRDKDKP